MQITYESNYDANSLGESLPKRITQDMVLALKERMDAMKELKSEIEKLSSNFLEAKIQGIPVSRGKLGLSVKESNRASVAWKQLFIDKIEELGEDSKAVCADISAKTPKTTSRKLEVVELD